MDWFTHCSNRSMVVVVVVVVMVMMVWDQIR